MIKSSVYIDSLSEERQIVVIAGIPFYKSTGSSSRFGGTWLPFLGIADAAAKGTYSASIIHGSYVHTEQNTWVERNLAREMEHYFKERTGWLIKLESVFSFEDDDFFDVIREIVPRRRSILHRLAQPILAVISASLGGGFWETREGGEVYSFLKERYPLEEMKSVLIVMDPEFVFTSEDYTLINNWLLEQGAVVDVTRRLQDRLSTGRPEGLDMSSGVSRTTLNDVYRFISIEKQERILVDLLSCIHEVNKKEVCAIEMCFSEAELVVDRIMRELSPIYLFIPPINESADRFVAAPVSVPQNIRSATRAMKGILQENIGDLIPYCERDDNTEEQREIIRETFLQISLYASRIMDGFITIGDKFAECEERLNSVSSKVSALPTKFR